MLEVNNKKILEVKKINKKFGGIKALDNINKIDTRWTP